MTNEILPESPSRNKVLAAKLSIIAAVISIMALLSLHFLSPEFAPSWRMVSEYANGEFEWVLFVFFSFWGISSCCTDDFKVAGVTVSLTGNDGVVLEQGTAQPDPEDSDLWIYRAKTSNATVAGTKVTAVATDLPRNVTNAEKVA